MDTQTFLTHIINLLVMITIIIALIDFCFYLIRSWRQLNPPTQSSDFYQQVKNLLRNDDSQLIPSTV